jgi:pyruvate formate lyase activating enzyme
MELDHEVVVDRRANGAPKARVFDIERYATQDGPGIRTTVFLKGCPLRCLWCHNPEAISPAPSLLLTTEKCIGCGSCVEVCPNAVHRFEGDNHLLDRDACERCGKCAAECFAGALELAGKEMTLEEVFGEVLLDRNVYEHSGGGMTVSGGEPLSQFPFTQALVQRAHQDGIHAAVDTSGFCPWEYLEKIAPDTDLFLYDLKQMDSEVHQELTGVPNGRILENLQKLDGQGKPIWIRIPLIPGMNDSDENYHKIGRFLAPFRNISRVEILRYHRLAESKYDRMGLEYPLTGMDTPEEHLAVSRKEILDGYGLQKVIWH